MMMVPGINLYVLLSSSNSPTKSTPGPLIAIDLPVFDIDIDVHTYDDNDNDDDDDDNDNDGNDNDLVSINITRVIPSTTTINRNGDQSSIIQWILTTNDDDRT